MALKDKWVKHTIDDTFHYWRFQKEIKTLNGVVGVYLNISKYKSKYHCDGLIRINGLDFDIKIVPVKSLHRAQYDGIYAVYAELGKILHLAQGMSKEIWGLCK